MSHLPTSPHCLTGSILLTLKIQNYMTLMYFDRKYQGIFIILIQYKLINNSFVFEK